MTRGARLVNGLVAPGFEPVANEFAAMTAEARNYSARDPAIVRLWTNAWPEMVPFLAFDMEIRRIVCSTNAIESLNARLRRAVNARGHFPTEQAALKVLYLAVCGLDPHRPRQGPLVQPLEGSV